MFRSIKYQVMFFAGCILLTTVLSVVGYSYVSLASMQEKIQQESHDAARQQARQWLLTLADGQASEVARSFELALDAAETLAALLAGKTVQFASDWPIAGAPPDGITAGDAPDFALTLCPAGDALHLVPRIGVLGVGCKRGTSAETLAEAFAAFCAQNRLAPQCITAAASIDLKQNEAGLLTFCKSHSWPVQFFTAEQLRAAPGSFTPSAFVQSVTGVDNVCERSAVLAAGGTLVFHKYAHTGVTFALAVRPYAPDWRWQNV